MKVRILHLMFGMAISAWGFLWIGSPSGSDSLVALAINNATVLQAQEVVSQEKANEVITLAKENGYMSFDVSHMTNATCQKPTLFIETTTNNRMAACQLSDGSVFLAFLKGSMVSGSQPQSL